MLFGGHEKSSLAGVVEPIPGSCDSFGHISAPAVNRSAEAPPAGGNRAGRLTSSGYGPIALEPEFGSIHLAENCLQPEKPLARYVFPSEPQNYYAKLQESIDQEHSRRLNWLQAGPIPCAESQQDF